MQDLKCSWAIVHLLEGWDSSAREPFRKHLIKTHQQQPRAPRASLLSSPRRHGRVAAQGIVAGDLSIGEQGSRTAMRLQMGQTVFAFESRGVAARGGELLLGGCAGPERRLSRS